jgi:hypothetical protein
MLLRLIRMLAANLVVAGAVSTEMQFNNFVSTYNKSYNNATERAHRFDVFKMMLGVIDERNKDGTLGVHDVNEFTDLTPDEFASMYLNRGYKPSRGGVAYTHNLTSKGDTVDWRFSNPPVMTAVKNQAGCGSCWAFSATEQIETDYFFAKGELLTLSPQQIVSCDKRSSGCSGGTTESAFDYVREAGGIEMDSDYPYTSASGSSGSCRADSSKMWDIVGGYHKISTGASGEKNMYRQIYKSPMSICVDAGKWQTYREGIVGASCGSQVDHCVQLVGLNVDSGTDYWIVRNSWASSWGQDGFIYVQAGATFPPSPPLPPPYLAFPPPLPFLPPLLAPPPSPPPAGINACAIANDATTVQIGAPTPPPPGPAPGK